MIRKLIASSQQETMIKKLYVLSRITCDRFTKFDLKYFMLRNTQEHKVCILNSTHLLTHSEVQSFVDKTNNQVKVHHKYDLKYYFSGIYSQLEC